MKKIAVILFWLLSLTWGILATLAGVVMATTCLCRGLKPKIFHGNIYFDHVRPYGSNNFGPFFFLGDDALAFTPYHEAGHGLQNILYGPFYLFVVGIPSQLWFTRFWKENAAQREHPTWSDAERWAAYEKHPIERQASQWGGAIYN
jgi:hypothetical protein